MLLNINSPLLMNIPMVVLMSAIMTRSDLIRDLFSKHRATMILHGSRLTNILIALVICTSGILIIKMVTRRIVTRRTITSEILTNEILTSGVLTTVTLTSLLRSSRAHSNRIRNRGSHVNNRFLFKSLHNNSSSSNSSNSNSNNLLHRSPDLDDRLLSRRLSNNGRRFIAHLQLRMKKKMMMMTTLLCGLSLKRSARVLLNPIMKRLSNVLPRHKTTVLPRHKATVLVKPLRTSLQNDDRLLLAVELPWTPRLTKMKKYSSNISGVIVEKQWSVIAKTNFFGVLIKKSLDVLIKKNLGVLIKRNLGVLARKSICVPVALLLNIVASMSLTVPIGAMDMKIIIQPIVLALDLTLSSNSAPTIILLPCDVKDVIAATGK